MPMPTAKEIVQDWINKGIQDAEEQLKQLNAKKDKMSWTCWLEWNGMVRIHWEFTKECLEEMKIEFERLGSLGINGDRQEASPEEIISWVKGRKKYFVKMVITTHTPCSSNPIKNLIVMEKMDVWRKFGDDGAESMKHLLERLWRIHGPDGRGWERG
jgi:hypothetical protein